MVPEEDDDEDEFVPLCKPFRVAEVVIVLACLVTLVATHFPFHDLPIGQLPYATLLCVIPTYYTLSIIGIIDLLCQVLRNPIANTPMIIFCLLFSFASFVASVLLFTHYTDAEEMIFTFQNLVVVVLIASFTMFLAVVYLLDAVFIMRCASRYPVV